MKTPGRNTMRRAVLAGVLVLACGFSAAAEVAPPPMGFDLAITLSDKAAKRLHATKEGITVSARYYGDPTPHAQKHANEVGQIDLGGEMLRLPGRAGPARISGKKILAGRLGWIQEGAKVNVNVFSSRLANKDNILSCDFIDADVAQVLKAQPIALHCALIEEKVPTEVKPKQP